MPVTRSTIRERARNPEQTHIRRQTGRGMERLLLVLTAIVVVCALSLHGRGATGTRNEGTASASEPFRGGQARAAASFLQTIASPVERQYTAGKIFLHLPGNGEAECRMSGEIGQIHVPIPRGALDPRAYGAAGASETFEIELTRRPTRCRCLPPPT